MQNALANDKISAGHARALLSVTNPSDQRILFGRIMGMGLSVRETEQQALELNEGGRAAASSKKAKPAPAKDPDVVNIEQQFIEALGTKVTLKGNLSKGSLQIDYYNKDDLDRLFNLICGK